MRDFVAQYKADRGCCRCGIRDPRVLDLHHQNGRDKIMAVSQLICRSGIDDIRAEMQKCRVVCANCHRIEHAEAAQIAAAGFFRAS